MNHCSHSQAAHYNKKFPELMQLALRGGLSHLHFESESDESQGRKSTGPCFLRGAMDGIPQDQNIAGPPTLIIEENILCTPNQNTDSQ